MTKQCPNCESEYVEQRDGCCRCADCGWFENIDGQWHTCPEPVKPKEIVPDRSVPVLDADPDKLAGANHHEDRHDSNVREYLGGLVTLTTTEDSDYDENEDEHRDG